MSLVGLELVVAAVVVFAIIYLVWGRKEFASTYDAGRRFWPGRGPFNAWFRKK